MQPYLYIAQDVEHSKAIKCRLLSEYLQVLRQTFALKDCLALQDERRMLHAVYRVGSFLPNPDPPSLSLRFACPATLKVSFRRCWGP